MSGREDKGVKTHFIFFVVVRPSPRGAITRDKPTSIMATRVPFHPGRSLPPSRAHLYYYCTQREPYIARTTTAVYWRRVARTSIFVFPVHLFSRVPFPPYTIRCKSHHRKTTIKIARVTGNLFFPSYFLTLSFLLLMSIRLSLIAATGRDTDISRSLTHIPHARDYRVWISRICVSRRLI